MTQRQEPVDPVAALRGDVETIVREAEGSEDELRGIELARDDGFRALARRAEDLDEALGNVELAVKAARMKLDDLRRRWNDPDARS